MTADAGGCFVLWAGLQFEAGGVCPEVVRPASGDLGLPVSRTSELCHWIVQNQCPYQLIVVGWGGWMGEGGWV